ncbi:CBS domain-containing protein [Georgenia sp. 10Sc9-8]|uniref:CBS domain-containing protein n=1 Tax=Georgenia halotolerans TaxID=3028317 RepID=A0ABT5U0M4_9MICO|nr:CBS domain-containing protein [Georgenia halotolerans]
MRISEVIRRKGDRVVTVSRGASVADLIEMLVEHRIGAAVVIDASGAVEGIVSERDVVLALRHAGPATREVTVGEIMTADVMTCVPEDDTETLARTMTEKRVRHLPVVVDGRLAGIVSIGDIVKQRLDELQLERDELVSYVQR